MTAETKPSFDPEAEPRRLVDDLPYTGWDRADRREAEATLSEFARRAYEQGAADMRERAALACEELRPFVASDPTCRSGGYYEAAGRVRALPLSETR